MSFKKENNRITIVIDDTTVLKGIPYEITEWTFKSRTPLEWILNFYKESKNCIRPQSCDDEKIRNKFNTYRFDDHKEEVISLLKRVTTVCVETVKLRRELKEMDWGAQPDLKLTMIQKPNRVKNKPRKKLKIRKKGEQSDGQSKLSA